MFSAGVPLVPVPGPAAFPSACDSEVVREERGAGSLSSGQARTPTSHWRLSGKPGCPLEGHRLKHTVPEKHLVGPVGPHLASPGQG